MARIQGMVSQIARIKGIGGGRWHGSKKWSHRLHGLKGLEAADGTDLRNGATDCTD